MLQAEVKEIINLALVSMDKFICTLRLNNSCSVKELTTKSLDTLKC